MRNKTKLFKRRYNGMKNNVKLSLLRQGFKGMKNEIVELVKGLDYHYDDVTHQSGYVIFRRTNKKPVTFYFGCDDKFTLYETQSERDGIHETWLQEHRVNVKSDKESYEKEKVNATGMKAMTGKTGSKSSRVVRRVKVLEANKEKK